MRLVYVGAHCFEPPSALHVKGLSARDGASLTRGCESASSRKRERSWVRILSCSWCAHTHTLARMHKHTHKKAPLAPVVNSASLAVLVVLKG